MKGVCRACQYLIPAACTRIFPSVRLFGTSGGISLILPSGLLFPFAELQALELKGTCEGNSSWRCCLKCSLDYEHITFGPGGPDSCEGQSLLRVGRGLCLGCLMVWMGQFIAKPICFMPLNAICILGAEKLLMT